MNIELNTIDRIVLAYKNFKSEYIIGNPFLYLIFLAACVAILILAVSLGLVYLGWGHAFDFIFIYFVLYAYECYRLKKKLGAFKAQEEDFWRWRQ
ncbi:MAG: hypothetical protein PHY15_06790 [Eubacteriales bacterium]|nr:hypothetical protein [Eubacteriales bacterium]